jgi:ABC-type Fe3+ transport system, permease component
MGGGGRGRGGHGHGAAVTLFEFPGRRVFEWLLLLPLAMPAYVTAYAYTDFLQFSGPLQVGLRETFGLEGRLLPEVRSLWGAIWVFTFSLYPYVYLLARTALGERAAHLMEAARLLGAPLSRRITSIALPLARPAVAAGVALALMETLADFGVTSYFGIQTFTTGIIKAWLSMDNRIAAAQLSTMLLALVLVLLWLEHRAERRMRFTAKGTGHAGATEAQPVPLRGLARGLAWGVCTLPVFMGFVAPVAFMLRPLASDWSVLPWSRFLEWAWNSVRLGGITAGLAVAVALALAFAVRRRPDLLTRGVVRLASVGYAVPGAVIVVGLLLPVGWVQAHFPHWGVGALVTTTAVGIVWAYLVRFLRSGAAIGAKRLCAHSGQPGRLGPHAGRGQRAPDGQCALAAAAPLYRRRRAAGVCGRDERAARHHGAAPLQQRHPGRGGLPAGAR